MDGPTTKVAAARQLESLTRCSDLVLESCTESVRRVLGGVPSIVQSLIQAKHLTGGAQTVILHRACTSYRPGRDTAVRRTLSVRHLLTVPTFNTYIHTYLLPIGSDAGRLMTRAPADGRSRSSSVCDSGKHRRNQGLGLCSHWASRRAVRYGLTGAAYWWRDSERDPDKLSVVQTFMLP